MTSVLRSAPAAPMLTSFTIQATLSPLTDQQAGKYPLGPAPPISRQSHRKLPGMLIDFCLLRGTRRWSLSCGIAPYSHRRRATRIPSGSSHHGADFGFQAWCEGRLHGRPAEQGAMKGEPLF